MRKQFVLFVVMWEEVKGTKFWAKELAQSL